MDSYEIPSRNGAEIREAFDLFDKDRDGEISADELISVLSRLGPAPSKAQAKLMLNNITQGTSDKINFEQFQMWICQKVASTSKEDKMKGAFRVFDRDGNGFIDKDELSQVMAVVGKEISEQDLEGMIRVADKNNDGRVDYNEFVKMMSHSGM